MSNFFVSGPAHLAVGLGSSKALVYGGLSERGASLNEVMFEKNLICDIGSIIGMPSDILIGGKLITLSMQIIWRNPTVLAALQGRFFGGVAGQLQAGEIGSLILQENLAFPVMILSQYPTIKSDFYGSEVPGINLLNGYCTGNQQWNLSTTEQIFNVQFKGLYLPNFSTTAWQGYNFDTSGFPPIA